MQRNGDEPSLDSISPQLNTKRKENGTPLTLLCFSFLFDFPNTLSKHQNSA
jgi:hypothetical protein